MKWMRWPAMQARRRNHGATQAESDVWAKPLLRGFSACLGAVAMTIPSVACCTGHGRASDIFHLPLLVPGGEPSGRLQTGQGGRLVYKLIHNGLDRGVGMPSRVAFTAHGQ